MLWLFMTAVGVGFAFYTIPGLINTETVHRGITQGFRPALLFQLGSLCSDTLWLTVAFCGATTVVHNVVVRVALLLLSACVLVHLAWSNLQRAWRNMLPAAPQARSSNSFIAGALLTLADPITGLFWLGIGSAVVAKEITSPRIQHFAVAAAGILLTGLLWAFAVASLSSFGRQFMTPTILRWFSVATAIPLAYFGISLLLNALRFLVD